jgi:hypothetical protein
MDKLDTLVTRHRDGATAALNRAKSGAGQTARLNPVLIEQFGHLMRENLSTGEVPVRKAYLASIVDRVEVDDREVRILGRKDVLEQCVMASRGPPGAGSQICTGLAGQPERNCEPICACSSIIIPAAQANPREIAKTSLRRLPVRRETRNQSFQ